MEKIKTVIENYATREDLQLFHETIDTLCAKGIKKGAFQNYAVLADILQILTICEDEIRKNL